MFPASGVTCALFRFPNKKGGPLSGRPFCVPAPKTPRRSDGLKAMDTLDFWFGTFMIFVLATIQMVVFIWMTGVDIVWGEMNYGELAKRSQPPQKPFVAEIKVVGGGLKGEGRREPPRPRRGRRHGS
jgi:hypothetical protein